MMGWYHSDSRAVVPPISPRHHPVRRPKPCPPSRHPPVCSLTQRLTWKGKCVSGKARDSSPSTSSPSSSWTPKFKEFPSPGPGEGRGNFQLMCILSPFKKKLFSLKKKKNT